MKKRHIKNKGNVAKEFFIGIGVLCFVMLFLIVIFGTSAMDYSFDSSIYDIRDGYIYNVSMETKVSLYLKYFDYSNCTAKVYYNDAELLNDDYVVSGSRTVVYGDNDVVLDEYVNVIYGDVNFDGYVNDRDLELFGEKLIDNDISDFLIKVMDIDADGSVHMNDLVMLDKAMNSDYINLAFDNNDILLQSYEEGRISYVINPKYGKNTNLRWVSDDDNIAIVNEAGVITGGTVEGETVVKAYTVDNSLSAEVNVKVDNTIQLSSYSGTAFVKGKSLEVGIKAVSYDDITCSVDNDVLATCSIVNKKLIITAGNSTGSTNVKVLSDKYGDVDFALYIDSAFVSVVTKYGCGFVGSGGSVLVSPLNAGGIHLEVLNPDIISEAYYSSYGRLHVYTSDKVGRGQVKVIANNADVYDIFTYDTYTLTGANGSVMNIGDTKSFEFELNGPGTLSCVSDDSSIASCSMEGNTMNVTGNSKGFTTIRIHNTIWYNPGGCSYEGQLGCYWDCSSVKLFTAVVQEGS